MLFKSTLVLAFVALANIVSAIQTPACVIATIGDNTKNPDDLATICSSKTIQSQLSDNCGSKAESALSFFANICKSNGHDVVIASTATASGATATGTGATSTASGFTTAVSTSGSKTTGTSPSGSASPTGSASAYPSPSTAGAAGGQHLSSTAFAAAVFFGAAALL
ncbi:hypothetical protein N7486_010120 [Penicillium sp. IBT 16267x]|nr:hypothetical protein N7486_010120 [Penicillium sp. IBT 16267x]